MKNKEKKVLHYNKKGKEKTNDKQLYLYIYIGNTMKQKTSK
jgi:hypothetical protein